MKRGDKVLIARHQAPLHAPPVFIEAYVHNVSGGRITYSTNPPPVFGAVSGTCSKHDRGVSWARGWDTKEATALRTAVVLGT